MWNNSELGFSQNVTVEQVRNGIREDGLETAVIQLSGSIDGESGNDVIIRTRNLSANESQTIIDHINTKVGTAEVKRIETVGAVIGSEVIQKYTFKCSVILWRYDFIYDNPL